MRNALSPGSPVHSLPKLMVLSAKEETLVTKDATDKWVGRLCNGVGLESVISGIVGASVSVTF